MIITILGRQPQLGRAELERVFGAEKTHIFNEQTMLVDVDEFTIDDFGGTQKAGRVVLECTAHSFQDLSQKIITLYTKKFTDFEGKITLGISYFTDEKNPRTSARDVQKIGITLKQKAKKHAVNIRLLPNVDLALSSATSHHNKLGGSDKKIELLIIKQREKIIIAESIGVQNITAYAARDQGRPKRDAFVGMLPPKLAQIIVNLAAGSQKNALVLDPFCGTGVVLQEAALCGFPVYGSDLSEKMVDFSTQNLSWLQDVYGKKFAPRLKLSIEKIEAGDATDHQWRPIPGIIAGELYLGQPFSAPPSPSKLTEVRGNCDFIITRFLKNLATQIPSGTSLCLAIPAWRGKDGGFTHLKLLDSLKKIGYNQTELRHVSHSDLLYYRENQVVARELLVLTRS